VVHKLKPVSIFLDNDGAALVRPKQVFKTLSGVHGKYVCMWFTCHNHFLANKYTKISNILKKVLKQPGVVHDINHSKSTKIVYTVGTQHFN